MKGLYYHLTGVDSHCVTAQAVGDHFDARLAVYEGSDCDELVCLASRASIGDKVTWRTAKDLAYKVYVAGDNDSKGPFTLSLTVCNRKEAKWH